MERDDFHIIHHYEIETLSPLHIGSGDSLRRDFDYLEFQNESGGNKTIALLDHEKVLRIVGESGVGEWVQQIDAGRSTRDWLRRYKSDLNAAHISLREIEYRESERMQEFKPMITDAHGLPYLPGSSLKGAIRTALLAVGLRKAGKISQDLGVDIWRWDGVGKFFGQDMNLDLLRFVAPSDALFSKTRCLPVDLLNKTRKGWTWKQQNEKQFLEVIPKGQRSHTRILYPKRLFEVMQDPRYAGHRVEVRRAYGHGAILRALHEHNLHLLRLELDFWDKQERNPAEAGEYCEYLKGILDRAKGFDPSQEALVRVGFATGWTSITGGWQEYCMGYGDFEDLMYMRKRAGLPYPKTRKLAKGYIPFGYFCLRHVEGDRRFFPKPQAIMINAPMPDQPRASGVSTGLEAPVIDVPPPLQPSGDEVFVAQPQAETESRYTEANDRLRRGQELVATYSPQPGEKAPLKTFKLLIGGPGQEQFVQLSYRADLPPGQYCKVRITDLDQRSGQVRTIEFRGLC